MTALWTHLRAYLTRADLLLVAAAVLGWAGYVLLLPGQHPDAAARYAPGEADVLQDVEAFLAVRGYAADGLEAHVSLRRHSDLLNALQADFGRRATLRLLQDPDVAARVPAYYWQVRYQAGPAGTDEEEGGEDARYLLSVSLGGGVWAFRQPPRPQDPSPRRLNQSRHVDRNALQGAFDVADGPEEPAARVDLSAVSDSLLAAALSFNPTETLWRGDPDRLGHTPDTADLHAALGQDGRAFFHPGFGPEVAVALARRHLLQTAWDAGDFRADSVWLLPGRDNRVARVRFVRAEPLYGQQVRADVTVASAGALQEIDVGFNADAPTPRATLRTFASVLQVAVYVLILLVLIVVFFKRFVARLIDGKAALVDGTVIGLLVAVTLGLSAGMDFNGPVESDWVAFFVRLAVALVAGAATAIFTMILAGTTDSMARTKWSAKLHAASLVRLGSFRNVYVGRALLRGACLAFVLLGVTVGVLVLFPQAALHFSQDAGAFLDAESYQPMTSAAAASAVNAYLVLLFVLLGVGTFVYHLWKRAAPVIGVVVGVMALMQGAFIEMAPAWYTWLLSGLWGAVLAGAFWRTDFLTSFVAFFLALLVWSLNEGWLVEGSPMWRDVLLAGLLVLGVAALGLLGVASGRTRREVAEYVPAYINELTHQERLKRELEIARQVQASFLPRRMPQVDGLDIAAMCLAAHEVGGDYYDFVQVAPGRLAVVVGDVSGKGTQAAFFMTLTKGFVQTLCREDRSPAEVMRRLNLLFYENAPRGTFVSMIYGVLDVEARTFTFARAGHNPVILRRSPSQEARLMQPTGLAIGLVTGPTFDESIEEVTLSLRLGDVLVFYTDGFSEAMNRAKDLYGDDRLARKVGDVGPGSANEILRAVSEDVHHFVEAAGRHDDMTMVVVKLVPRADEAPAASAHRSLVEKA